MTYVTRNLSIFAECTSSTAHPNGKHDPGNTDAPVNANSSVVTVKHIGARVTTEDPVNMSGQGKDL